MDMTLPQGLMFDLATGKDPQSRMKPWLVLQHVLHSEQDWLDLIEYLAAPYDPKPDTPQSKPWAYKRYQQRGVGTPWTDEFASIIIEFGNETWHNGHFEDWLGFHTRNAIWQGGQGIRPVQHVPDREHEDEPLLEVAGPGRARSASAWAAATATPAWTPTAR